MFAQDFKRREHLPAQILNEALMVTKNQNICLLSATDHIANYLFQITVVNERVMSGILTPFYQQLREY